MMPSQPDYLACWLGISRVGGVVALIDARLVGQSLAHCINVTRADHVILAAEYRDVFAAARPRLDRAPTIWRSGAAENGADLDVALAAMDTSPLLATERAEVA